MGKECLSTDYQSQAGLLPLERDLLVQYQQLAIKLDRLANEIAKLNKRLPSLDGDSQAPPPAEALLGNMRNLERKIGLVYTLFKTAVYSMQLRNKEMDEQANDYYVQPLLSEPEDDTIHRSES